MRKYMNGLPQNGLIVHKGAVSHILEPPIRRKVSRNSNHARDLGTNHHVFALPWAHQEGGMQPPNVNSTYILQCFPCIHPIHPLRLGPWTLNRISLEYVLLSLLGILRVLIGDMIPSIVVRNLLFFKGMRSLILFYTITVLDDWFTTDI